MSLTLFFFIIASMRQIRATSRNSGLCAAQGLTTISSSTRHRLRSEGQHVQECGKHHGKYKTRFSCLLIPSLSTLVDRCVSHRCVFHVVALDRIIFLAETLARFAFELVQCRRNVVRKRVPINQAFRPGNFQKCRKMYIGPGNRICIFHFAC